MPERARPLPIGALHDFGLGRHRCIGEHFAWAELMIAAAVVVSRWRLRHSPGHDAAAVREMFSAHPYPGGLTMTPARR
ncbi:cytochrome P450 [Sinosporangium siamense]|uniref:cytochrome P450 n=1 Tax=Sinosporangium siamense TaxID=1367973 RepID=UPI0035A24AB9